MGIKMKVTVIALGYVGLANAVVLSERGFDVVAYDNDAAKIAELKKGKAPFDEAGLSVALYKNRKRISFTNDEKEAYTSSNVFFVAVDTPALPDGGSNLTHLNEVVSCVEKYVKEELFLVIRSTVPVGTNGKLSASVKSLSGARIHIVSNPEFLAEGRALLEERSPSRIVIGSNEKASRDLLRVLYRKAISSGVPYYEMDPASAEFVKYASNLFLALKISYVNELARLAEPLGADIGAVTLAMGADPRIGHSMTKAGVGYGGACLPKDGSALQREAKELGFRLSLVEDASLVNQTQPFFFYQKIVKRLGPLSNKKVAVLGLSFKAGTSDVRHTVADYFVKSLLKDGAEVRSYDPSAKARKAFSGLVAVSHKHIIASTLEAALTGADAILILTEDEAFASLDENKLLRAMSGRFIFDGRNLYDTRHFRYFDYVSVGRAEHKPR